MYKQIITIKNKHGEFGYSSLRKCCDLNPEFKYEKIVRKEMPFYHQGSWFNRVTFNEPIDND
ncbi:MAG: hypothetical protein ACOC2U_03620 [bacterium]